MALVRAQRTTAAALVVVAGLAVAGLPSAGHALTRESRPALLTHHVRASATADGPSLPGRIAYTTAGYSESKTRSQLWGTGLTTAGLDGSDERTLDTPAGNGADFAPQWSPDGRWLAFTSSLDQQPQTHVALIPRDGGVPQPIADGTSPVWSPDGSALAWIGTEVGSEDSQLVVAPVLTTTADAVDLGAVATFDLGGIGAYPAFSPDGRDIAVTIVQPDYSNVLWNYPLDGSKPIRLSHGSVQVEAHYGPPVSWSPQGDAVLFLGDADESDGIAPQPYLVDPDGTDQHLLLDNGVRIYDSEAVWSPDGGTIALDVNAIADGIEIVDRGGTIVRHLAANEFETYDGLAFSPDGTLVYTVARPRTADLVHTPPDLWALPVDGSDPRQITTDHSAFPGTVEGVDPGHALRIFGDTPVSTAAAAARSAFRTAPTAVLAPSDEPAIALDAGSLAAALRAPLLLTDHARLSGTARRALHRLGTTKVALVGAFAAKVRSALAADGVVSGSAAPTASPYRAAAAIATALHASRVTLVPLGRGRTAWADALAASGYAAGRGAPMLFIARHRLPAATAAALRRLAPRHLCVAASHSIDRGVLRRAARIAGARVRRLVATSPVSLARRLARRAHAAGSRLRNLVVVPRQLNAASAVAGALAAADRSVLLVAPRHAGPRSGYRRFLHEHRRAIERAHLLGSVHAITPHVEAAAERSLALRGQSAS